MVGRHKKTKGRGVGLVGGGGPPACIPPVLLPTSLLPALSCASQVSLKIPSSTTTSNSVSGQQSTSSKIAVADPR